MSMTSGAASTKRSASAPAARSVAQVMRPRAASRSAASSLPFSTMRPSALLDAGEAALHELVADVGHHDVQAGQRRDLGDARAHLSGARHEHFLHAHGVPPESVTRASGCAARARHGRRRIEPAHATAGRAAGHSRQRRGAGTTAPPAPATMAAWTDRARSSAARCCATRSRRSTRATRSTSSKAPCTTTPTGCAPPSRSASTPPTASARSCSAAAAAATARPA